MSELRQDPTTREWVIVAPERARRPQETSRKRPVEKIPEWDESCPFCPGNEDQTPGEVLRLQVKNGNSDWAVRVVPNKFAALSPGEDGDSAVDSLFFRNRTGIGAHEVIIESPSHRMSMALMPYEQVEQILLAYQHRYNALKENPQFKFITIFKNHGSAMPAAAA